MLFQVESGKQTAAAPAVRPSAPCTQEKGAQTSCMMAQQHFLLAQLLKCLMSGFRTYLMCQAVL
jgi:hypothetical protein